MARSGCDGWVVMTTNDEEAAFDPGTRCRFDVRRSTVDGRRSTLERVRARAQEVLRKTIVGPKSNHRLG
jgi:hypothetical protein